MLLIYLYLKLFWLLSHRRQSHYRSYRKPTPDTGFKFRTKPRWVINRIIEHKAHMPNAGCSNIATSFNRRFGDRETVSKSWVNTTIKKYKHEILLKRKQIKNKKPRPTNINRIWGMDLTGKYDLDKNSHHILGSVDHGSRANLCLQAIHSKASIHLLRIILDTINKYGKPEAIRTDNETVFTSRLFRFGLWFLGIKHQRTDVGCPWMNGRIERFFGTLKQKLNQINVLDFDHLNLHLNDFRFWYNYVRTHQNIDNQTPNEVWSGKGFKRKAYFYSAWDGILKGYWHPPD